MVLFQTRKRGGLNLPWPFSKYEKVLTYRGRVPNTEKWEALTRLATYPYLLPSVKERLVPNCVSFNSRLQLFGILCHGRSASRLPSRLLLLLLLLLLFLGGSGGGCCLVGWLVLLLVVFFCCCLFVLFVCLFFKSQLKITSLIL